MHKVSTVTGSVHLKSKDDEAKERGWGIGTVQENRVDMERWATSHLSHFGDAFRKASFCLGWCLALWSESR